LRIAAATGRLVNISATGALVRATEPLAANLEYPIYLDVPPARVQLTGRVTRSRSAPDSTNGGAREDYLLGVRFTVLPPTARMAVARLCGEALTRREGGRGQVAGGRGWQ
jgi:hypothetical protein